MNYPRKLRIESDGTPAKTRIVDAETGEDLRLPVRAINWNIEVGRTSTAKIELSFVEADITSEVNEQDLHEQENADRPA